MKNEIKFLYYHFLLNQRPKHINSFMCGVLCKYLGPKLVVYPREAVEVVLGVLYEQAG